MLAEAIIRIGRPLARSSMKAADRIRWLTDVGNETCKNYFQNVWVAELGPEEARDSLHYLQIGEMKEDGKQSVFEVDSKRIAAFPFHYPNGGNPDKRPSSLNEITLDLSGLLERLEQEKDRIARCRIWLNPSLNVSGDIEAYRQPLW